MHLSWACGAALRFLLSAELRVCGGSCPAAGGVLVPGPGTEPVCPELEGGLLTAGPQGSPLALDFDLRSDSTLQGSGFSLQIKPVPDGVGLCAGSGSPGLPIVSLAWFACLMWRKRFWLGRESVRWPICVSNTNAPERVLIVPPMAVNPTPHRLRAWHMPSHPDAHPHLAPLHILSTPCEHHGLRKALPAVRPHEDALPCSLTASVFLLEVLCGISGSSVVKPVCVARQAGARPFCSLEAPFSFRLGQLSKHTCREGMKRWKCVSSLICFWADCTQRLRQFFANIGLNPGSPWECKWVRKPFTYRIMSLKKPIKQ